MPPDHCRNSFRFPGGGPWTPDADAPAVCPEYCRRVVGAVSSYVLRLRWYRSVLARVLVVIMAQQKHVDRVVQEIRDEDPAALVEMEERAKRPKHMSLWDKLQVLEKFKNSGLHAGDHAG